MLKLLMAFGLIMMDLSAVEQPANRKHKMCMQVCSDCKNVNNMHECLTKCQGIVDTSSCQTKSPTIKTHSHANDYGNMMFIQRKEQLIAQYPLANDIIENQGRRFKADSRVVAGGEIVATINVLVGLRQGAVGVIEKIKRNTRDADGMAILRQLQQALQQMDFGIQRIQRNSHWKLNDLRKEANAATLLAKNIYNQGSTQAFVVAKDRSTITKTKDAVFCRVQCRANTCNKDLKLFAKCMAGCPESKIQNCIKGAKTPARQGRASNYEQYENWLQTHGMSHLEEAQQVVRPDANVNATPDAYVHSNRNANANSDVYAHPNRNANANAYADPDAKAMVVRR